MDRNTVTGLLLMFLLVLGYNWYSALNAEDAPAPTETVQNGDTPSPEATEQVASTSKENTFINEVTQADDSLSMARATAEFQNRFGPFAPAAQGKDSRFTLENRRVRVTIDAHGGWFSTATLTDGYKTFWDSAAVQLFDPERSNIDLWLEVPGVGMVNTSELYFTKVRDGKTSDGQELVLRLSTDRSDAFLEYRYVLRDDSYVVDVSIQAIGLNAIANLPATRLDWNAAGMHLEKGIDWERQHSSVFYRKMGKGRSYLGEGRDNDDEVSKPLNWMAFKQNYFSALVISRDGFAEGAFLRSFPPKDDRDSLTNMFFEARLPLALESTPASTKKLEFYFGPNDLDELRGLNVDEVDRIIDYGWWIFGWMNRWVVRPVFNFMIGIIGNVGITIILLTFFIKLVLTPVTWKNFLSSAKMRVLRPEMDEINEKHKDDAMAKQQATMALYRETGVNPFAGCLPMLLQMPILYAMFRFFPANIDLRGKSLLWADDLGAYDSIVTWTTEIPFISSVYGNHVSGFALLMAASTFFYSRMNTANMPNTSQPGMPNMKVIMNIFPLITLIFFNRFAAGLNFYYFCANVISIGQMMLIKKFLIDEDKIRAKIQENKKKPKKKSAFQQRLEEMQKLQQERAKQQNKKK